MAIIPLIREGTMVVATWVPDLGGVLATKQAVVYIFFSVLLLQLIFGFSVTFTRFHQVNRFGKGAGSTQIPPRYPSLIPWIGVTIPFLWDNARTFRHVTSYAGRLTSTRIPFLGTEIFAFQDRKTIQNIWKQPTLASPISIYVYTMKYFFGMPEKALATYRADNSGPLPKPYPGSNVPPEDRVDHITHHGFLRAWAGPCLNSTTRRFMESLLAREAQASLPHEWTEMPDLGAFFKDLPGTALVQCIYGPTLLEVSPNFMDGLWKFDINVPWFARGMPSFLLPEPYRLRERSVEHLKKWYRYAREHFDESLVDEDKDGDPLWGSNLMRYRQEKLLQVRDHDDDALARLDLGLAWGAVGNTIPCAMLMAFHIFRDPLLLARVRETLSDHFSNCPAMDIDPSKLEKEPLLSSLYAETLRLYVKTYFVVSSPHHDVDLGRWWLPKGRIGLMNAGISQMDGSYWNTQGDAHPVESFWADRFLVDPADPNSGPINPAFRDSDLVHPEKAAADGKPYFSMDGLEGAWFPYGGGHSICPGRFLAKRAVLFTCAVLVRQYDIEVFRDTIEQSQWRFGLGVGGVTHAIPFRIRKRETADCIA